MGQAVSSFVSCCCTEPDDERPWREKIKTNEKKVIFAVDPKFSKEEIAQEQGGLARPQIMHAGGGVGPPLPPGMPPIGGPGAPLLPQEIAYQETAKLDNYTDNYGGQEEVRNKKIQCNMKVIL